MRRNFLTGLIVCLIPTALAGAFVGIAANKELHGQTGFRKGIDLAGGTILVYEVDLKKTQSRQDKAADPDADPAAEGEGLSADGIRKLAENLKRRIDPADLRNVVVRPVGRSRVEIILPFAGSTSGGKEGANEEFVREVRGLVAQTGVLEFRILANQADDERGIADAQAAIAAADTDPKVKEDLLRLARNGEPPPPPTGGPYTVNINGTEQDAVQYEWVELGKEERDSLRLSNTYAESTDGEAGRLWQDLARTRGKTYLYQFPAGEANNRGSASMLLYSREFVKTAPAQAEEGKKVEYFVLTRVSPTDAFRVGKEDELRATADTDSRLNPCVAFTFGSAGAARFGRMTERNRPSGGVFRSLAVVMDRMVVSAPSLNAVIRDRGQISGGSFDMPGVNRLVYILRSGALNAELKPEPVSENSVGATLGQDTIVKGLWSVLGAFALVMAFMVVYYKFAGFVACLALLANLLLTVGFMVAVNAAFTLPGLAGVVLMLGMAVDANVLIYERMREERDKGANLVTAIRLGYDRAFPTIIDTHLTSIFTAVVLYTFGNDNLKGFAVSLTLGLIISLFTALYMTRLVFDYVTYKRWMTAFTPHQLFARPNLNFMKVRYPVFVATAVVTVLGLGLFLARGEAVLNVDFTKGTAYGGRLSEPRGLSDTLGKPGLLTLLGEKRQGERLAVEDVVWLGKPEDDPDGKRKAADWIYKVQYKDGSDAVVTLSPDRAWIDAGEAFQLADVKARAAALPGLSVEQVTLSGVDSNLPSGTSKSFLVRTTEKESDLVQVSLDRLLRDESGAPLLETDRLKDKKVAGPVATLTFDKPTAPGYLKGFLVRELKLANRVPAVGGTNPVAVTGVPTEGDSPEARAAQEAEVRTGRFTTLRVDVGNNSEFRLLTDAGKAGADAARVAEEQASFDRVLDAAVKAFEARPLPDRLETFDPSLAADTRNKALAAILASWLAILGYLWFRFGSWTFGLAAVVCLIHDLCFTLGAIALCHYLHDNPVGQLLGLQDFKIDLPAVAALLTLVGYSVNDTIVVFDRIKEVRGKNPLLTPQMINDSVNQTLSRTVLASLTVFLVVGVLYWFGGEGVHLFAFVMVVGVIVGTFSSIYVASPMLLLLGEGHPRPNERGGPTSATPTTPTTAEITA